MFKNSFYQNKIFLSSTKPTYSQQLESERDELLAERESFIASNRQLEDKIQQLETILAQQTEFIEQNETELAQRNQADSEIQKLQRKLSEREQYFQREMTDKIDVIGKLEEQLRNKRYFLVESQVVVPLGNTTQYMQSNERFYVK